MIAVLLALGAAALWGAGDFLGGLSSRRLPVLVVLFWSQLAGLAGLVLWIGVTGGARPGATVLLALAAGLAGVVGLACLYRGLSIGAMGIVAPISATSPVVPLVVDLFHGRSPAFVQWLGIGLALLGVVLVSREPTAEGGAGRHRSVATGVGLALVAALGFGLFVVWLGAAAQESAQWATATARVGSVGSVVLVLAWTHTVPRVSRRLWPLVIGVGVLDTGANVLIAIATTHGTIGIVAVLSALYPITTILLARAILHERLGPTRTAGGLIALGGAALIAAG